MEEEDEMSWRLFLKTKGITNEERVKRIIKISEKNKKNASKFWADRWKKRYKWICDFSLEELKEKHKEKLDTIHNKEEAENVGILIMGDYYLEGFSSRKCSKLMAKLVGYETEYMDFYGSSSYYYLMKITTE